MITKLSGTIPEKLKLATEILISHWHDKNKFRIAQHCHAYELRNDIIKLIQIFDINYHNYIVDVWFNTLTGHMEVTMSIDNIREEVQYKV